MIADKLMYEQRKGKLAGIHGRLGNLATISANYDRAVSNAFPLLDYIVVDTFTQAENAMNFLGVSEIGKAGFISLDRVEPVKQFWPPEHCERLFDHAIPSDEKYREALYLAMKDTVVC